MVDNKEFVVIGRLGKPRGVRGALNVIPLTDVPGRFAGMKEIHVGFDGQWEPMKIASIEYMAERPVIRFAAVVTPEAAARLTNRELAVPRDEVAKLPKDTFFDFDLVGCDVIDDKSRNKIGQVADVEHFPANDVYVVNLTGGSQLRVPAVRAFVKDVDLAKRRVIIAGIELLIPSDG